MQTVLQDILNKNLSSAAIFQDNTALFDAISEAFDDLSQQLEMLRNNRQQQETSALFGLEASLVEALKMLDSRRSVCENTQDLFQLTKQANEIKGLVLKTTQKERQLIDEVNHLKAVQAIAKAGSWEVDMTESIDSKQHYWSDELFHILGIEPGSIELTYNTYLALIHPDDQGLFEREVTRAIASGSMYDIEYRIVRKNGIERFVRDVAQILIDHNTGMPAKMIGITFDITESKETKSALSHANDELQTLFATMEEVFWSSDLLQQKVLQMSPACKQVYGYEPEEMKNDPDLWLKVILEEDKPLIEKELPFLASGQAIRNEYRVLHKDGTVRWLETKINPTLNIEGKLIRLDGINSDITTRKQAERALKANELKFRSLIQNSNDTITIADDSLQFTFVSESVIRMTGFSPDDILNTSILDYIHPEHHNTVQGMLAPLLENPGEPVNFEFRFRTKDGRWIWTEGQVTNLLQEEAVGGYVTNFRDITERKEYERSLEISNEELKKTNHELYASDRTIF